MFSLIVRVRATEAAEIFYRVSSFVCAVLKVVVVVLVTVSMYELRLAATVVAKSGLVMSVSSGLSDRGSRLWIVCRTMRSMSSMIMFGVVGRGVCF